MGKASPIWYNSGNWIDGLKEGKYIVSVKRARLYDVFALLTVIVVVCLDQWTKTLVVEHLHFGQIVPLPVVGHYLALEYIRNSGAAFSIFTGNFLLLVFIAVAICVVIYLYARIINTGPLVYKIVFGMIIGGALGNLLDRALRGGSVVDFISFRVPEINYYFAIFNIADACISVGVILLFVLMLFGGGLKQPANEPQSGSTTPQPEKTSSIHGGTYRPNE